MNKQNTLLDDDKKIWLEEDMFMINIAQFDGFSVDYLEIFPNAIEENVIHNSCDEWIYVLEGSLLFFRGEDKIELNKGDYVEVPINTVHGSINKSNETVKILSVCSPPFQLDFIKKVCQ